jgi:hypothetical protein
MPWGRLDDSLYDHPKLDLIPVEERLAAIGLWARAISWCNRFLTDGLVPRDRIAKLDGTADLADRLVVAGLFDSGGNVPSGAYQIHDFLSFNDSREKVMERRQHDADRKAKWRAAREAEKNGKRPRGARHSGTARSNGQIVPPSVTPSGTPDKPVLSQRDSRTRESRPDPTRPDPSHDSLDRDSAGARPDVQALLDRGWPKVTKAQRLVLDEVAGRHDRTGHGFAAEVIRNTAPDADPLESVMAADRMWQAGQRQRADAEDQAWQRTKAEEREQAGHVLGDLAPDDVDTKAWT